MTYIDFFKACALTSAAAPKLDMMEAGLQAGREDEKAGISALEVRTTRNQRCISYLSKSKAGEKVLEARERAEGLLEGRLDLSRKGVKVERCLLGKGLKDLDGEEYFVLICSFSPSSSPPLRALAEEECLSFGKGVGYVHASGAAFRGFSSFSAPSIRFGLKAWVERLGEAGKVDARILDAWGELADMDALWDFSPSLIHGGWKRGQAGFAGGSLCSLSEWEEAQISDPARDLEWMFAQDLSQRQIDAFMQGYAMAMNDSMDPFILPRAKLWRQMEMGAELLEAQKKGEERAASFLAQQLLRLSADLRSIAPQKPQGPLPSQTLEEGDKLPRRRIEDLEEEPSCQPSEAPSATSQLPPPEPAGKAKEAEEEEKKEEEAPPDPALQSAMWRVAVQAALAKREGRDLKAEVEAERKKREAENLNEMETAIFGAASFAAGKSPSLGAPVHIKEGGGAREKEKAEEGATAYLDPQPFPPSSKSSTGSQTKVIDRIEGNGNE